MKTLPFKSSQFLSLGVELEYQIVNPFTQDLASRSKDLITNIKNSPFQNIIKPEVTQSMIEINSSVHQNTRSLAEELLEIRAFLMDQAKQIGVCFCGGGTHPYQKWSLRKIFPSERFKNLARQYRFLTKRATVFGQQIHVGCSNPDDALYLTHALARYVPQFIALSAGSPFYEGKDSGYFSSRSHVFAAFPMSGVIPYLLTWQEFSNYFYKMRNLEIIETMKDFYWDIRPKPEFGTVEIRVFDVPLTMTKAILLVAYVQTLSLYLLKERPILVSPDLYHLYNYNRFQATRYGFDGNFINPCTFKKSAIADDILETITTIEKYSHQLNNQAYLSLLKEDVLTKQNDATLLRKIFKDVGSLHELVREQCVMWGAD
jgi:carboxylate-amine ligase